MKSVLYKFCWNPALWMITISASMTPLSPEFTLVILLPRSSASPLGKILLIAIFTPGWRLLMAWHMARTPPTMRLGGSRFKLLVPTWRITKRQSLGKLPFFTLQRTCSILSPPMPKLAVLPNLFTRLEWCTKFWIRESPNKTVVAGFVQISSSRCW